MDSGTQFRNNLILLCALAIVSFLCTIPLNWFTLTNANSSFGGTLPGSIIVTGINGKLTLLVMTPIWLLVIISACATMVAVTNLLGLTSVPKLAPILALLLTGVHYATPIFMADEHLAISAGPIVALLATIAACIPAHFCQTDGSSLCN